MFGRRVAYICFLSCPHATCASGTVATVCLLSLQQYQYHIFSSGRGFLSRMRIDVTKEVVATLLHKGCVVGFQRSEGYTSGARVADTNCRALDKAATCWLVVFRLCRCFLLAC